MYRAQYLQIFGLTEYDDRAINASLELLKSKVNELPELKELLLKHPYHGNFASMTKVEDEREINEDSVIEMLLVCMFSYPTMDAFHLCLMDAFKHGTISNINREKLMNAFSKM